MAKKILIVDDEVETAGLVRNKLETDGYAVVMSHTGCDGLIQARAHLPDLILMDIVLPDMDGPDVIKELHDHPATLGIPVLFLSGIVHDDHSAADPEVTVGGRTYQAIAKPFTYDELKTKINRFLSLT